VDGICRVLASPVSDCAGVLALTELASATTSNKPVNSRIFRKTMDM
jgi:hypothetical protein